MKEESNKTASFDWQQWHHHHHDGGGALILITLGILLLLNNFGYLPWNIWQVLWRFWPALLVIWGLRMILGRNILTNILSLLIIVVVILYAVSVVNPSFSELLKHYLPWWPTYNQPSSYFDQFGS